jgi:hypothetical protein
MYEIPSAAPCRKACSYAAAVVDLSPVSKPLQELVTICAASSSLILANVSRKSAS